MGRCVVKQKPGQGFPFYPYQVQMKSIDFICTYTL